MFLEDLFSSFFFYLQNIIVYHEKVCGLFFKVCDTANKPISFQTLL